MATPDGYAATSWRKGYGDYVHEARPVHAAPGALARRHGDGALRCARPSPRARAGPAFPARDAEAPDRAAEAMGFDPIMATELEFFLFRGTRRDPRNGYRDLTPDQRATTRTTTSSRPPRRNTSCAHPQPSGRMGMPVENSKGEAEAGRRSSTSAMPDALDDRRPSRDRQARGEGDRCISRPCRGELPAEMACRPAGSSCHVHQSLWKDGANAFHDPRANTACPS
jgi:glutamine synthetase